MAFSVGVEHPFVGTDAERLAIEVSGMHKGRVFLTTDTHKAWWCDGAAWYEIVGVGVTDHGALTGLLVDDHTQYHTDARHAALLASVHASGAAIANAPLVADGAAATTFDTLINTPGQSQSVVISGAGSITVSRSFVVAQAIGSPAVDYLLHAPSSAPQVGTWMILSAHAGDQIIILHNQGGEGELLLRNGDNAAVAANEGLLFVNTYLTDHYAWVQVSGGAIDHGTLEGLAGDDHAQYHNDARALTWHGTLAGAHVTNGDSHDHSGGDGAQIDHGGLAGLGDDDHGQYHTDARHAAIDAADHASGAATDGQLLAADGAGGAAWESIIVSGITRTVGAGKDHATVQAAIDWFAGKILSADCYIDVDAGSYTETLTVSGFLCAGSARLVIRGDQRVLVGMSYVGGVGADTVPGNRGAKTNGGTGNVTLTRSGASNEILTVGLSTANPDFDADGIVSGDKVAVWDGASITEVTLTAAANATLTQAGAWPANINLLGSAICLKPNRKLVGSVTVYSPCTIQGFENSQEATATSFTVYDVCSLYNTMILGHADNVCVLVDRSRAVFEGNSAFSIWNGGTYSLLVRYGGVARAYDIVSVKGASGYMLLSQRNSTMEVSRGICVAAGNVCAQAEYGSSMIADYGYCLNSPFGFRASFGGTVECSYAKAYTFSNTGFNSAYGSILRASSATAHNCLNGYVASNNAYLLANSSDANNASNGTNYVPAVSDTEGASGGRVSWS